MGFIRLPKFVNIKEIGYMELRDLKFSDVFKISKILKKINLKSEAKQVIRNVDVKGKNVNEIGWEVIIDAVLIAAENLHLAEREVNDFLGSLIGISGKEFAQLSPTEGFEVVAKLKEHKDLPDFLQQAVK